MTHHEPSSLEVLITIAVGNLFGSVYKTAVDSLNLAGSERVLDFGSGAGMPARLMAGRLAEGGGALTCVDVSKAWIKTAQKHVKGYPNVAFLLGEIAELDIPDESHDVVFIHFVIHDIPASQRLQVVKHLPYKLVKGGRLYPRATQRDRPRRDRSLDEAEWPGRTQVHCRQGAPHGADIRRHL